MRQDYETLGASLAGMGLLVTAAEIHGMVCGQLCSTQGDYVVLLTGKVLGQDAMQPELVSMLHEMAEEAREQLMEPGGFDFVPLLPDDDEDLELRLHALGRWCEGFTLGYAAGCSAGGSALPDEAREVLSDFTRIAEVDVSDDGADDEADYMEVAEYVRVAAASLFTPEYEQPEDSGDIPLH